MRKVVLALFSVLTLYAHQIAIPIVATPPVIDGDGGDPCWSSAAIVFGLTDWRKLTPMKEQTLLRLVRNGDTLYGFLFCEQRQTDKFPPADHPVMKHVYDTNCIEMFFWNGEEISQILLNYVDGVFEQQLLPDATLGVKRGPAFQSGISCKSVVKPHSWSTEFALPLKALKLKGEGFGFNLVRNNLVEKETGSWMSPAKLRDSWAALYDDFPRVAFSEKPVPQFDADGLSVKAL